MIVGCIFSNCTTYAINFNFGSAAANALVADFVNYNDYFNTGGARLGFWQNAFATLADWRYRGCVEAYAWGPSPAP